MAERSDLYRNTYSQFNEHVLGIARCPGAEDSLPFPRQLGAASLEWIPRQAAMKMALAIPLTALGGCSGDSSGVSSGVEVVIGSVGGCSGEIAGVCVGSRASVCCNGVMDGPGLASE